MTNLDVIRVSNLIYKYSSHNKRSTNGVLEGELRDLSLQIPKFVARSGERILLCGANGAGKSTFLSILGGRKLIGLNAATVFERDCFHDCFLGSQVCYLGDWWRTDFFLDTTVRSFLGPQSCESEKCLKLCKVLQVSLDWRISVLSDGQRRRCQILVALMASDSFSVYILDEVTADLDIASRERLLDWLKLESELHGALILLATHIMDGMDEWATRVIYMEGGKITRDLAQFAVPNIYQSVRSWVLESCS